MRNDAGAGNMVSVSEPRRLRVEPKWSDAGSQTEEKTFEERTSQQEYDLLRKWTRRIESYASSAQFLALDVSGPNSSEPAEELGFSLNQRTVGLVCFPRKRFCPSSDSAPDHVYLGMCSTALLAALGDAVQVCLQ